MNPDGILKQLKFVTGNPNKVREARQILGIEVEQVPLKELLEIQSADLSEIVRHKAGQAYAALGCPVMVEDSGLIFQAWDPLPGPLVKWFESSVGCEGMIKMLQGFENRKATAACAIAVYDGEEFKIARGAVDGEIAESVRGANGFGWDVIFIPEGTTKTYAELPPEEKNADSHRRRALEKLKTLLMLKT